MVIVNKDDYTDIVRYLDYKGFSPSQIRYICVKILKMNKLVVARKVNKYVSGKWIEMAKTRFFKEKIVNEMRRLGLCE